MTIIINPRPLLYFCVWGWEASNLIMMTSLNHNPVGRVLCSLDKVLSLAESKYRKEGCSAFYTVTSNFQESCLIINGKCPAGHRFVWKSSSEQAVT